MKNIDISIIIVSYNTRDLLVECIKSIIQTVQKNSFEVIVVDNNSRDGSVEAIQKLKDKDQHYSSKVKIIANSENYGFSKANNIGVERSSGTYVLFLNPDTVIYEKTIDGMIKFMEDHPDCGASTCFLRMPNGKLDDASHRGFPTPWRSFTYFSGLSRSFPKIRSFQGYNLKYLDMTKTHKIEALAGAFMLVRRTAGEEVGWWDEDFFFYGEDLDFCYRLKEHNWKIYFVPHFEILHYKGVSGGIKNVSKHITTADRETKKRAIDARFNAMKIFYKKHYFNKYPPVVNYLVFSGIDLKSFLTKKKFL